MFKPQIQKTKILLIIAFINVLLVLFVANSKTYIKQPNFDMRVESTNHMNELINSVKQMDKIFVEDLDYYNSGLVGRLNSHITSKVDSTIIDSKIITTHPHFAAFIVYLLEDLDLNPGDDIAIAMSGSFPGANIALLSACNIFDLNPVVISSLGSSSYGANRENLTWIDFEKHLYNQGLIVNKSIGVSIGGREDLGDNLSDAGIELLEQKIFESKIKFINEEDLYKNIDKKWKSYYNKSKNYKAFINIGGGASSLGDGEGKNHMRGGVIYPISKDDLEEIYYSSDDLDSYYPDFKKSLAYKFLDKNIPFVNIKNIESLVKAKGVNDIADEEGFLFYDVTQFNVTVIWISLVISLFISITIGVLSHYQIKRRMLEDEIDSII